MIIDLSGGADATSYPISYLDAVPSSGFTNNTYRTTKLVLRRIDSGTFVMGSNQSDESHRVTLTRPFYMGIFEVTQKQYILVTGASYANSTYGTGDGYPACNISYNKIRGSENGAKWPSSYSVDPTSFMGILRNRTGLSFDLPTNAQTEYACRAGTTTEYYWGKTNSSIYAYSTKSHRVVGMKPANSWGLYNMSDNAWEWCLDWSGTHAYGTDPKGPSSGSYRVLRGGCYELADSTKWKPTFSYSSWWCDPSGNRWSEFLVDRNGIGFRLSLIVQ